MSAGGSRFSGDQTSELRALCKRLCGKESVSVHVLLAPSEHGVEAVSLQSGLGRESWCILCVSSGA